MRKIIIAALIALLPTVAAAQQFNNIPSGTVIGRTQSGTGPAQAIPFATLIASMLASSPTIPTINTSSILFAGSTSGTATLKAQATAGNPTVQLPTASGILADNATLPLALATTGMLTCPNCAVSVSTRTAAVAQDLSSYSVIRTSGYASVGDGGGAMFKNVGSTPFLDSYVTAGSITGAGTGCTNATTYRVQLTGGTGRGFYANVTAAGAVVTVVQIAENGGNGYTVGDVLTGSITGCTFTWTVSAVSAPLASFTDNASTHWQYIVDAGNYINARQFGVKADFSTNDQPSIQAAINFADFQNYTSASNGCAGGAGSCGTTVLLPAGTMVINNTLTVFDSVELRGLGQFNSGLLLGASFPAGNDAIHLCDSNIQLACFGPRVSNLSITSPASLTATTSYLINSVSAQQTTALEHVALYALNQRGCLKYTNGYGGAAKVNFFDIFCTLSSASTSDGIVINPTTTVNISFDGGLIVEAGGGGYSGNAVNWTSGNLFINGFHTEGIVTGISANATVSNYQASLRGATGGSGCTQLVNLQSTNTFGNFSIGTSQKNGCTRLVTDGQSGGSNQTTDQVLDKVFNP